MTNSKKQLREFGLLIGIVFPILIGLILPLLSGHSIRLWTLWIAIPSLTLGLFYPKGLQIPYKLWMSLGHYLGWVNSHLILGLVFLLILQPIAIIMKIFKYDPLRKKWSKTTTYREGKSSNKTDLRRIF